MKINMTNVNRIWKDLIFGIGEVSQITGVSARQIRYWEKKGYITPLDKEEAAMRRYGLPDLYQVSLIKHYLDEGFTLSKAAEKAQRAHDKYRKLKTFFKQRVKQVSFDEEDKGLIDLGQVMSPDGKQYYLVGCIRDGKNEFQLRPLTAEPDSKNE